MSSDSNKLPDNGELPHDLIGHLVILNVNPKFGRIIDRIRLAPKGVEMKIIVLVQDQELLAQNPKWRPNNDTHVYYVDGCPGQEECLEQVGIDQAGTAVILADPLHGDLADAHTTLVAVAIEGRNSNIHTICDLISSVNRVHLKSTEVNEVVCAGELTERLISQSCISPGFKNVFEHMLSTDTNTNHVYLPEVPKQSANKSYRDLVRTIIEKRAPFVVCGFVVKWTDGGAMDNAQTIVLNPRAGKEPGKDTILDTNAKLIVIAKECPTLESWCP